MAIGRKTGGRTKGTRNLPKPDPAEPAADAEAPGAAGRAAGGAAPAGTISAGRGRARVREAKAELKGDLPPTRHERLDRLIPFENNARTHSQASIDKLAKLISTFGWTSPILVAGRHILGGHARRLAAMQLGIEIVPVIDLKHLSRGMQEAVIVSDNRAAEDGGWDEGLLIGAFERIQEAGIDLALTAFDPGEIAGFLATDMGGLLTGKDKDDDAHAVTCPACGHQFSP